MPTKHKLIELTLEEYKSILDGTAGDALKAKITPDDDGGGIIIVVRP